MFYGWILAGVAFLLLMLSNGAIMYSYSVVAVPIGLEFEASRTAMMLGITVMTLCGGIVSPWFGSLVDRWSLKGMMLLGALGMSLGYVALSLTTATWQVPLVYGALMMLGTNLLGPLTTSTLLARWFTKKRGMALGIAAVGTSVGGFVFPPLIQGLIDQHEWRTALRYLGAGLFIVAVPAVLLVVNSPQLRGLHADGAPMDPDFVPPVAAPVSFGLLLKNRNFILIAIVMSLLFATYTGVMSNMVPFAMGRGLTADEGALLISALAVAGIVGKLVFGAVADKIDLRWGLGASMALVIASMLVFAYFQGLTALTVGSALIGLAAGGMLPVWGALLAVLFGAANYGRVMGMMNPLIMPLTLAGAPLAGFIFDQTGAYTGAFLTFAGALCLGIALLFLINMSDRAEA
ncbi:MAG: MFS transporter [Aequoribacter sp.]|jgi:MFS family permease|uniref:MFS transporter n=1 Tax=Aequoribacter sp. TaxID=2847771 RepID=UPI003C432423